VTVIFPMDDEPFADFLQRQAPEGWTITATKHGTYQITTDDGLTATVDYRGNISAGWKVKIHNTGISTEFTVKTPDGRELWFHDCWNA
jgi:hypothetical protein